jgi:hypothetical protein
MRSVIAVGAVLAVAIAASMPASAQSPNNVRDLRAFTRALQGSPAVQGSSSSSTEAGRPNWSAASNVNRPDTTNQNSLPKQRVDGSYQ